MLYTHFKPQLHPQVVDKSDADDELHIFTDWNDPPWGFL
jgi:hypothetical protein